MDGDSITFLVNWRDVAAYALAFCGGLLTLFAGIAWALAKWGVNKVLAKQDETNERIDKFERHVDLRLLGLDRRVTRVEARVGMPTPIPSDDGEAFLG